MKLHIQNVGLMVALCGAAVSVAAVAMSASYQYLGIDYLDVAEKSFFGVSGVNGLMQLLLLIGAFLLLVGVLPMGREGLRYIILEAQLVLSGLIFFFLDGSSVYLGRSIVLMLTFWALWKFNLLRGSVSKISSLGTELLGWGKALNSLSGLAAGGDLLFFSSYLNYKRHGKKLDLIWTCLNAPFAFFAHLDMAAHLAGRIGWSEVMHLHLAFLAIAIGSWFLVLNARTELDLDGPNKPMPPIQLLPRIDLHWQWSERLQNWIPYGACGTPFEDGDIQSGIPSGTYWELDDDILKKRKRRHALLSLDPQNRNEAENLELSMLDSEIKPVVDEIQKRWHSLGIETRSEFLVANDKWRDARYEFMEQMEESQVNGFDLLDRAINGLVPAT